MVKIHFFKGGKRFFTAEDDFIPEVGDFTVIDSVGYVVVSRRWILRSEDHRWSHININVEVMK